MGSPELYIVTAFIALLCQYFSIAMGVGYGTTLTPILIILNFNPLQIVPAVLFSHIVAGIVGGFVHYRIGNINFNSRHKGEPLSWLRPWCFPQSTDAKVISILATFGIIGILVGVFTAVNIPQIILKTYIGVMVLGVGLVIIFKRYRNQSGVISWRNLVLLGLLSGFNKGASGGGYVPLVIGGQIIAGREIRNSIGTTTITVAIVSIVGFISYLLIGGNIEWSLIGATSIGSIIVAPFAAMTVRMVKTNTIQFIIGLVTIMLGTMILVKTFIL